MDKERYDIIKTEFELKEENKMQTQRFQLIKEIDGD